MITHALSGILFGIVAGISPGPLMVLVISETMTHGPRAGVKTALAPLLTDTPIIVLSLLLIGQVRDAGPLLGILSLCGAGYILYLAYEGWMSGALDLAGTGQKSAGLVKGVITNLLNPHPYFFWITVGSPLILRAADQSLPAAAVFLLGFYVCIIGAKMTIVLMVGRYRERVNTYYGIIQKVLSGVLVLFSLLFIREAAGYLLPIF